MGGDPIAGEAGRDPRTPRGRRVAALAASALVFLLMMFFLGDLHSGIPPTGLFDPDSYARMLRVERLLSGGGWYDNEVPWANAPYGGETLHWTRPLDVIIAAGAIPLEHFMPLRQAIVDWGSAFPVLLGILLVFAIAWGAGPYLGPRGLILIGFLAAIQPTLAHVFKWSYVDHHGLIALLFAIGWAGAARAYAENVRKPAIVIGIAAGMSLWVTVEALGWILTVAGAFCLLWIRENRSEWARANSILFTWATATSAVALVLERRPADLLAMEMDRLSLPYVALVAALAVGWTIVAKKLPAGAASSTARRFWTAVAAFAAPAIVTTAIFPKLLRGPVADVDPRVLPLLFEGNAEFSHFTIHNLLYLATLVGAIGPTLIVMVWAILRVRRGDRAAMRVATLTLSFIGIFLPLTLYQWRWATYLNVVAVLPWALAIRDVLRRGIAIGGWQRAIRVPLAILLATGHFMIAVAISRANLHAMRQQQIAARRSSPSQSSAAVSNRRIRPGRVQCTYTGLGRLLSGITREQPGKLIVMTTMYDGPQMAWQTGMRVVGSPYHRNGAGILDTDIALAEPDPTEAREVLDRRGVDFVVLCETGTTAGVMEEKAPKGLAARLIRGEVPPWLDPVSLPKGIDPGLGVYRVEHPVRRLPKS